MLAVPIRPTLLPSAVSMDQSILAVVVLPLLPTIPITIMPSLGFLYFCAAAMDSV